MLANNFLNDLHFIRFCIVININIILIISVGLASTAQFSLGLNHPRELTEIKILNPQEHSQVLAQKNMLS